VPNLISIAFPIILFHASDLFAQGHDANLEKYWSYRNRLKSEFMVVGDQPGMSMPAERSDTVSKTMYWSDNTIWLGWYIGMLALEYHLLTNDYEGFDQGDTSAIHITLDELYYALKGLRRLDEVAESSFPPPCDSIPDVRNGFFIRDDVPADFHIHFEGINTASSDGNDTVIFNKEMSQDQVYHVLMGLSLVKKFIPSSVEFNGMNLREEAITQALLIADWVNRDGWIIKNPACQNKDVDRGEQTSLLSFGINEAVKFISDNTVNYDSDIIQFYVFTWSSLVSPANPAYANVDNLHMAMSIAAMGKGWSDTTLSVMMNLAASNRWYAYPMVYAALHDDTTGGDFTAFRDTMNFWAESMLDEAPLEGPYTLYPDSNTHGYAVNNRFIRGRDKHYIGNFWTENCSFNGLDYMMLHNLYYTVTPSKWPRPVIIDGIKKHSAGTLKLFPNPASESLFLETHFSNRNINVKIFNFQGQMIYDSEFQDGHSISISLEIFPSGIYAVIAADANGNHATGKFVKHGN
jgi:hypothetical protein